MKITTKIRANPTRHLSYACRLQIINSVLFSLHNFWGSVFILPQSVLSEVDRKCREFLWGSTTEKKKILLVAWDKVCRPKKQGGLNIKGCKLWNIAMVGKLIWLIMEKNDILWLKWANGIYMNGEHDFWMHNPSNDSSWYWRKLHKIKIRMGSWYNEGKYCLTSNKHYSASRGYLELLGDATKMEAAELIWSRIVLPKHRVILWLAAQDRLLTKERMQRIGLVCDNTSCGLCEEDKLESSTHLFYECNWAEVAWDIVQQWIGIKLQHNEIKGSIDQDKAQTLEQVQERSHGRNLWSNDISNMGS